jgi:hypothetical protein
MSTLVHSVSRGSAVGIAIGYGQDDRGLGVRFPVGLRLHFFIVQTGSGGAFPGGKAAGA